MITAGKKIVLGVTGSIAAYKAAEIASRLTQQEAIVDVVMTEAAMRFISPLTFASLTGRPARSSLWEGGHIPHLDLGAEADAILIAPATAHTLARLATGQADDLLSSIVLATKSPVIIAPAMDANMYANSFTQENLGRLKRNGFVIIEPGHGRLASGKEGYGRLAESEHIIGILRKTLGREGSLCGKRLVVTAGGTRERVDMVRFIGNRSSGKMGYALAEAARDRGAEVTLVSAALHLAPPAGVEVVKVDSAADMEREVMHAVKDAGILIMAAAVADYRPRQVKDEKIKREGPITLELEPTPDILAAVPQGIFKVGFAAESGMLLERARAKLAAKKADLMVVNDITRPESGFDVDSIQVSIAYRTGRIEELPLLNKGEVAEIILDRIQQIEGA